MWGKFCYITNTIGRMSKDRLFEVCKISKKGEHICILDFASSVKHN